MKTLLLVIVLTCYIKSAKAWIVSCPRAHSVSNGRLVTRSHLRECRSLAAAAFNKNSIHDISLLPIVGALGLVFLDAEPARAVVASAVPIEIITSKTNSRISKETIQMPPSSITNYASTWAAALKRPSLLLSSSTVDTKQLTGSMLDEVWTLIDKFYIDRTFHNQDWNAVRQTYQEKLTGNNKEFSIVSEMVSSLNDKYSRMLDPAQYAAIQRFDLIGVGATLMPDAHQKLIVGAPPIPGSASAAAQLRVGDWITAVNGQSTLGKSAFAIIDQIAEQPNAPTIEFTIVPEQHANEPDYERFSKRIVLDRAFQTVQNPVVYKLTETRADGTKVGYIRISEFNSLVKTKLQDALAQLQNDGANAFVVDLRHNGGGAFQSAVEISSLFFQEKVATYVVDNSGARIPFRTAKDDVQASPDYPIAIWLDDKSASAAEVFAGSMHDNCRAVTMGGQSFGKGLIQAVYGLKNGAGLVLTVARYVTPGGTDIQGIGLRPDIQGHISPPIPGLLSDTSGVDFTDVKHRLDMCEVQDIGPTGNQALQ
jgi:carboxyl-terminal processing protease